MDQMSEETNNQNSNSVVADNSIINAANNTTNDIVAFRDSDLIQETSSRFVDNVHEDKWRLNDVRDMLSRPIRADRFKYSVSSVTGQLRFINPAQVFVSSNAYHEYLRKYSTFKATFCCQVRLNAQPFQTGAFQIAYCPPGHMATCALGAEDFLIAELNGFQTVRASAIPFVSGLPFSQVNKLPTATSSVLKVPYKWTTDVCSLSNINCGVFVWQTLQALGSKIAADFAEVSIYTWIEDLEVEGASSTDAAIFVSHVIPPDAVQRESVSLQAKTKAEEATTISSVAGKIGNVAGMLSKIPFVSDIAGPVSIAADMTSKVAGMFGLSKPFTQDPITNVNIQKPFGHANVDGLFTGNKFSVNRNQEIPVHAMGYVKEDEMATSYVIEKPSIWGAVPWAIGTAAGSLVMSTRISPGVFAPRFDAGPGLAQANTYLSYLAGIFKFYRGPIKFRFSVVANSFYSGRLRVVYEPRAPQLSSVNDTPLQFPQNISEVFDIKDAMEFEFIVPWIIENDWLPSVVTVQAPGVQYDMGRLTVWVENELRTNAQCPDSVAIWVSVVGTPDTEFCVPRALVDVVPNTAGIPEEPPPSLMERVRNRAPVSLQGKFDEAIQSIGDPSLSLRPLLKRYEPLTASAPAGVAISPWTFNVNDVSLLNWITRMYVHQTGAMRFWLPNHPGIVAAMFVDDPGHEYEPNAPVIDLDIAVTMPYLPDDMMDIEIPYYNIYPRINMQSQRYLDNTATDRNYMFYSGRCTSTAAVSFSEETLIYRAAGDDFNCGMLTGPRWTQKYGTYEPEEGAITPGLAPLG